MSNSSTKANIPMVINILTILFFQHIISDFLINQIPAVTGVVLPICENARHRRKVCAVDIFRAFFLQNSQHILRNPLYLRQFRWMHLLISDMIVGTRHENDIYTTLFA